MAPDDLILAESFCVETLHNSVRHFLNVFFAGAEHPTHVLKAEYVNLLKRLEAHHFDNVIKLQVVGIKVPRHCHHFNLIDDWVGILKVLQAPVNVNLLLWAWAS